MRLLDDAELNGIESGNPDGLSSQRIVEIFQAHAIKFSEASLRKYVQLGLLPRSVRVGRKGKHKGSQGMYPAGTVRQINQIKRMMALDFTIEDIKGQFLSIHSEIEDLDRTLGRIFDGLKKTIAGRAQTGERVDRLGREVEEAQRIAERLTEQLGGIEADITARARLRKAAV